MHHIFVWLFDNHIFELHENHSKTRGNYSSWWQWNKCCQYWLLNCSLSVSDSSHVPLLRWKKNRTGSHETDSVANADRTAADETHVYNCRRFVRCVIRQSGPVKRNEPVNVKNHVTSMISFAFSSANLEGPLIEFRLEFQSKEKRNYKYQKLCI